MSRTFYFGGQFNFRYKDYSEENIANDYRSKILGDYKKWLNEPKERYVKINDNNYYVGPFYFCESTDGEKIVNYEYDSVLLATDCFFVLSNESAPGTVTEIITASMVGKSVHIFYVKKDIPKEEVNTEFKSDLWYPITFAKNMSTYAEIHGFDTYEEAVNACVERVKELTK